MTDQQHAQAITDAAKAFNAAVYQAHEAGLTVKVETQEYTCTQWASPNTIIRVIVAREIHAV